MTTDAYCKNGHHGQLQLALHRGHLALKTPGLCTFHSACEVAYGFGSFTEVDFPLTQASFLRAVQRQKFDLAGSRSRHAVQPGDSSGVLLVGSLRGLVSLAGTPWWPDWAARSCFGRVPIPSTPLPGASYIWLTQERSTIYRIGDRTDQPQGDFLSARPGDANRGSAPRCARSTRPSSDRHRS